jgi:hypothetical protein
MPNQRSPCSHEMHNGMWALAQSGPNRGEARGIIECLDYVGSERTQKRSQLFSTSARCYGIIQACQARRKGRRSSTLAGYLVAATAVRVSWEVFPRDRRVQSAAIHRQVRENSFRKCRCKRPPIGI